MCVGLQWEEAKENEDEHDEKEEQKMKNGEIQEDGGGDWRRE
jgi:hypothetical protein